MSQLTKRLRLYGADCNQSSLVLEAIKRTGVDMQVRRRHCHCDACPHHGQVWLGVYMNSDETVYQRQIAETLRVLQQYGADHVSGITVRASLL
jgi:exo-beta-1,3-glucanase (GH17 family)